MCSVVRRSVFAQSSSRPAKPPSAKTNRTGVRRLAAARSQTPRGDFLDAVGHGPAPEVVVLANLDADAFPPGHSGLMASTASAAARRVAIGSSPRG